MKHLRMEPKRKNIGEILKHPIVQELGQLFKRADKQLYLVGGSVRDALLGEFHKDFDFATDATPGESAQIVKKWASNLWLIGARFGTVALTKGETKIEITTFRSEIYPEDTRHPQVRFSKDIMTDLSRRDFTINALAIKVPEGELLDPFGGQADLEEKILRTPLKPERSFTDDPLRMLRVVRFVATLGLRVSPEVKEAIKTHHSTLSIVSKERIRDEFSRTITGAHPVRALRLMMSTHLADEVIPELKSLKIMQDPDYHHKDVLEHTFMVVQRVKPDLALRLAAILHDLGKPKAKRVIDERVTFYNHDLIGAKMAEKRLRELRYPLQLIEEAVKLIALHMRAYTYYLGWTDKAVRKYIRDAGGLSPKLHALIRADCTSLNPMRVKKALAMLDELEARIKELEAKEESAKIRPPLDGHEVMAFLSISPGPLVGEALNLLLESKLEGTISTKEEARELLKKWAAGKGLLK